MATARRSAAGDILLIVLFLFTSLSVRHYPFPFANRLFLPLFFFLVSRRTCPHARILPEKKSHGLAPVCIPMPDILSHFPLCLSVPPWLRLALLIRRCRQERAILSARVFALCPACNGRASRRWTRDFVRLRRMRLRKLQNRGTFIDI